MNWPATQAASASAVAVLPIAAIEQHGPHLAVSTDSALVTAIAERAEQLLPNDIVLCPTQSFGASHHHLKFGATLSLSSETFTRVLIDLVHSLLQSGFQRIVLLNGHAGNAVPAQQALAILTEQNGHATQSNIVLASYWELAGETFCGAPPMESKSVRHACEYETSMMLHLFPQRVQMHNVRKAQYPLVNNYIGWQNGASGQGVIMPKGFHYISSTGAVGCPELATAAKGEHLVEAAVKATVEFLQDFAQWPLLSDLRTDAI